METRGFGDRYGVVLGQTLEMLTLQGVRGLGQRLGMLIFGGGGGTDVGYVNIVWPGKGGWGQRLGI